jgi:hypothetical protein
VASCSEQMKWIKKVKYSADTKTGHGTWGGADQYPLASRVMEQEIVVVMRPYLQLGRVSVWGRHDNQSPSLYTGGSKGQCHLLSMAQVMDRLREEFPPILLEYNGINHWACYHRRASAAVGHTPPAWMTKRAPPLCLPQQPCAPLRKSTRSSGRSEAHK